MAYTLCKINLVYKEVAGGTGSLNLPASVIVEKITTNNGSGSDLTRVADNVETPGSLEYSIFPDENRVTYTTGFTTLLLFRLAFLISNKPSGNVYDINLNSPTGTKATYLPLLASAPTVTEDAKNAFEGLITLQTISIKILGDNQAAKKVFNSRFSATDQNFEIWRELNDGTLKKIYKGLGFGLVSADSQSVTYKAKPILAKLDLPADYGLKNFWPDDEQAELREIPILHCAVIPYTEKIAQNRQWTEPFDGGNTYDGDNISWPTFEKSDLPKAQYQYFNNDILYFFPGITFTPFNLNKFEKCAKPVVQNQTFQTEGFYTGSTFISAPFHNVSGWKSIHGLPQDVNNNKNPVAGDHFYIDWATNPINVNAVYGLSLYKVFYNFGTITARIIYIQMSSGLELEIGSLIDGRRFKACFTNKNQKINEFFAGLNRTNYSQGILQENPRFWPTQPILTSNEYVSSSGLARMSRIHYNVDPGDPSTVGRMYNELRFGDVFTNRLIDTYTQWQYENWQDSSLEFKPFLTETIEAAGFTADISEVDFNAYMQFLGTTSITYREILEKLLPALGLAAVFDFQNDTLKVIKIDENEADVDTLTESDFSKLQIKLSADDTFRAVEFKNESMLRGENTRDFYSGVKYLEVIEQAIDSPNEGEKQKTVEMITMENPRAAEVAKYFLDNKFIYSFDAPAEERFYNINVGDWITLESDQVLEENGLARVLIVSKSTGETSISFTGVKYQTIN